MKRFNEFLSYDLHIGPSVVDTPHEKANEVMRSLQMVHSLGIIDHDRLIKMIRSNILIVAAYARAAAYNAEGTDWGIEEFIIPPMDRIVVEYERLKEKYPGVEFYKR